MEQQDIEHARTSKLPTALKIAAIYFGIVGVYGLLTPLVAENPWSWSNDRLSTWFKVAAYLTRISSVMFIVPAIGIFRRRRWAREVALLLITLHTLATLGVGNWGARDINAPIMPIFCILPLLLWNGLWFYLIYKKSSKEAVLLWYREKKENSRSSIDIGDGRC